MIFHGTGIEGLILIEPERMDDERGYFARTFCEQVFAARGLNTRWVQCSTSFNRRRGTVRGLHYQAPPESEIKLIRCTRGAVYDVIADLRPCSPHFGRTYAVEMSADNGLMLYVPAGCAHGFQTLVDDSELFYQISAFYQPEKARGVRWDDPRLAIPWPLEVTAISARDRALPSLKATPC